MSTIKSYLPALDTPDAWMDQAACLRVDPDLFFAGTSGPIPPEQLAEAMAVCAKCSVITKCLDNALDRHDEWAILGGTTPAQRQVIHKERWLINGA